MFGMNIPTDLTNGRTPLRYWGARAIFQRGTVDIVHDRQTYTGPDSDKALASPEFKALSFIWWLDHTGLPWLRAEAKKLSSDSNKVIHLAERRFLLAASPQSSYGYLYIGGMEFPVETAEYDLGALPTHKKWSGNFTPELGQRVKINMNGLGPGSIVSFFWEHDYAGVKVKLDTQPDWHKKQGQPPYALVFGVEVHAEDAPNGNATTEQG